MYNGNPNIDLEEDLLPLLKDIEGVVYTQTPEFFIDWDMMKVGVGYPPVVAGVVKTQKFKSAENIVRFVKNNKHQIVIYAFLRVYWSKELIKQEAPISPAYFLKYAKKPYFQLKSDDWKEEVEYSWKILGDIEGVSYTVYPKFVVNKSAYYGDGVFKAVDVNDPEPFPSWACDKNEFESVDDLREFVRLNKHRIIVHDISGPKLNILRSTHRNKVKFPIVGNIKSKYTFIDV
jgi:hypothetical protein